MKKLFFRLANGVLVVLLVLTMVSTVVETLAEQQYAARVKGGELSIGDVDINYLTGNVSLDDVRAVQAGQLVLRLDRLVANVALLDLLTGRVRFQSLYVSGFDLWVSRDAERLVVAGYEIPLEAFQTSEAEAASADDSAETFIQSFAIDEIGLEDVGAHYTDPQVEARLNLKQLAVAGFDSSQPERDTQVDLRLGIDSVTVKREGLTLELDEAAELQLSLRANRLLDKPNVKGELSLNNVVVHMAQEETLALTARLNDLSLDNIALEQLETLSFDMAAELGVLDMTYQGKSIQLAEGLTATAAAQVQGLQNSPVVNANLELADLLMTAPVLKKRLLQLSGLKLDQLVYEAAGVSLNQLDIRGLSVLSHEGEKGSLATAERLSIVGLELPELKGVNINQVELAGLDVTAVLNKQGELSRLQPVLDYLTPEQKPVSDSAAEGGEPSKPLTIALQRFSVTGDSQIYFKDNGVEPAFDRTIGIEQLEVKNINTADTRAYTELLLKASAGEYSKIDIAGRLQALAKNPSGFIKGQVTGVELVPISPYVLDATGYFIRTGQLAADIDVTLDRAELGGEVKVLLSAIKLESGNEEKVDKLKQSISMPLDTALGLLRDKNGDVALDLPMEGNINAPDFSLGSVVGQVSTKVLKKASIAGLKYAFQPYGAMISVGSWLGKKATSVRLDPLLYFPGELGLTDQHKAYLNKVAEIMNNKPGLRIKLCAQVVAAESRAFHQQALADDPQAAAPAPEKLLDMARQRAETARDYLVEERQVAAERLLLCQPAYDAESEALQSQVHLEI